MSEFEKEKLLNMIAVASLASLPFSRGLWNRIEQCLENLSHSFSQCELAEMSMRAIFNQHYHMYPRDPIYTRTLLQWFISLWDSKRWDGQESFLVPDQDETPFEIVYKTYLSPDGLSQVTLLEAVQGITRGTTGLSSWGAGNVLATWCLVNPHVLAGKRILELGAGIGQTACTLLSFLGSDMPLSYLATDCHPHVLSILHHNLTLIKEDLPSKVTMETFQARMNKLIESEEIPAGDTMAWQTEEDFESRGAQIRVRQLDWRRPPDGIVDTCDVVLAADVVYARNLLPHLAGILKHALSPAADVHSISKEDAPDSKEAKEKDKERAKLAYVACTRRSQETISEFLTQLSLNDMDYSTIYQTSLHREDALFGYDESHLPVKIYKIILRNDVIKR